MSVALIEKLKLKPNPVKKTLYSVNVPVKQQLVDVNVSVVNKTRENLINRANFLQKIKSRLNLEIKSPVLKQETTIQDRFMKVIGKPKKLEKRLVLKITSLEEKGSKKIPGLKKSRVTIPTKETFKSSPLIDIHNLDDEFLKTYLPKDQQLEIKLSPYYLKNRKYFINHILKIFGAYKSKLDEKEEKVTCDMLSKLGDKPFSLLTHQKIVKEYINLYTPFRGLLLYHGLGAGKTCASIAIMEGIKSFKKVIIMTPASLRKNYQKQLKECGDPLYRLEQHWTFLPVDVMSADETLLNSIYYVTSLTKPYIKKNKGVWLSNASLPANFSSLSSDEKYKINQQIDKMLENKYTFINYNGLREAAVVNMTNNYTKNIFNDSIVIIDEAHNFVSRIVNKIKKPESISKKLYELLTDAENAKVVLLSGTPMINYPNELGILFNLINGKIKTWELKLNTLTKDTIDEQYFKKIFYKLGVMDYFEYKPNTTTLIVTKNPYGFLNTYDQDKFTGVIYDERGNINDDDFIKLVEDTIKKTKHFEIESTNENSYHLLPDTLDEFKKQFIDLKTNHIKNPKKFQKRIMGLTSYFKSAQENLMPEIKKHHKVFIDLSDYQLGPYSSARKDERKLEKTNAKKKKKDPLFETGVSTYRIFSRAFCNFVFPENIDRPMPNDGEKVDLYNELDEDILDSPSKDELQANPDGRYDLEDVQKPQPHMDDTYENRLQTALVSLKQNSSKIFTKEHLLKYSPKFLHMLENIEDPENSGLHLIYSQFRTLEGIGVFKLVLEENGFIHFKLMKNELGVYVADINPEDIGKPAFALYTGTESEEEKEIIRSIYNNDWSDLTSPMQESLKQISTSNVMGEVIKVLMISSSGAEGINLKNVRYVHITEPYWHPVRVEQVIGRARRICSHESLPEDLRNIEVFYYLMKFSEEQLGNTNYRELIINDKDADGKKTITSDEKLLELSDNKQKLNKELLMAVKSTSMDCLLHSKKKDDKCLLLTSTYTSKFAYKPEYEKDKDDETQDLNETTGKLTGLKRFPYKGKSYALDKETKKLYDYDAYKKNQAIEVGYIEVDSKKNIKVILK
jgi:hypothetical protein